MRIPVTLKDGSEQIVDHSDLQPLMDAQKLMFFKRKTGWVVVGRDNVRGSGGIYVGENRRIVQSSST
jgi:hypothetical protein